MPRYEYWGHGPWRIMWLFPLVFIGLFAIFIFRGIGRCGWHARDERRDAGETAMEILDLRYARGEISKEQYQEMKRTLSG